MWINKTHFPLRLPLDKQFDTNCIILATRNPLDAFYSFYNMMATFTHTKTVAEDVTVAPYNKYWDQFLETEILIWNLYFDYWIQKA